MNIKKLQDQDVRGKKVIVRTDFNVSVDQSGDVKSIYKIAAAKVTIDFLVNNGASHIALLTHFGRPEDSDDKMTFSLEKLVDDVERILDRDVTFVPDCVGDHIENAMDQYAEGKVLLLENVRFYAEEKKDLDSFASRLCAPFDLYVNDAFAVCHRAHASVHAITKCVPSCAGMWLQKELAHLAQVKNAPEHPAIAIIGGAKIDTKIPMITEFSKKYDTVLVGGRTAVEAREKEMVFDTKVIFPTDFEYKFYDIGPKTIMRFCNEIKIAKTVVWNGPMGLIEKSEYKKGTFELISAIAQNKECFSLIGGGESVQLVEECGLMDEISFVSTGGGAMLAYLGGDTMPGVDVLLY
jgi:triosephosphate isomerase (TIM)